MKLVKPLLSLLILLLFSSVFAVVILGGVQTPVAEAQESLITTRNELVMAISAASECGTIYVGDIDFSSSNGARNDVLRIELNKSLTIKNGKQDGKAVFSGGSFKVNGTKVSGKKLDLNLDGITFDGGVDGDTLTEADWELPCDSYGVPTSDEPLKAQYALSFSGNVDANVCGCEFKRYMYEYGGAVWCRYGDYSQDLDSLSKFGDNTVCKLNLSFYDSTFSGNSATYAGGAVCLEGDGDNVDFYAKNCSFSNNKSANVSFAEGGGAVYLKKVNATFLGCNLSNNKANCLYGETLPTSDSTKGGAVFANNAVLNMTNCVVAENVASYGGGLSLEYTATKFNGCVIAENRAEQNKIYSEWDKGPWGNVGLGGAVYVSTGDGKSVLFFNSSVYLNSAKNAYGGLYAFYTGEDYDNQPQTSGKVDFVLCTYAANSCDTDYDLTASEYPWYDAPGDVWEIPYVSALGCIVADDSFKTGNFPRYETPSADNGYNYFATVEKAAEDKAVTVESEYSEYVQLNAEADFAYQTTVPSDAVKDLIYDSFGACVGTFKLGSNSASSVTICFKLNYGKTVDGYLTVSYGETVALPLPVRRGYTFSGWVSADGTVFSSDTTLLYDGTKTLVLTAVWTKNPVNVLAISLSVCGAVLIIGALVLVAVLRKKKRKKALEIAAADVDVTEEVEKIEKTLPDTEALTPREKEVLQLLLEGKQRGEIGKLLFVSESTVKKHIASIYQKLGVSTRGELFALFR